MMYDPCTPGAIIVGCPVPALPAAEPFIAIALVILTIAAIAIRRFA